jgi:hypothetical protein
LLTKVTRRNVAVPAAGADDAGAGADDAGAAAGDAAADLARGKASRACGDRCILAEAAAVGTAWTDGTGCLIAVAAAAPAPGEPAPGEPPPDDEHAASTTASTPGMSAPAASCRDRCLVLLKTIRPIPCCPCRGRVGGVTAGHPSAWETPAALPDNGN